MKVEGKVIILTGAGSGLGLECVQSKLSQIIELISGLSKAGAHVIAVDRDPSNIKETEYLHPYQLDVTDWKAMEKLYKDTSARFGRVDVVCNNAGLFERISKSRGSKYSERWSFLGGRRC